VKVIGVVQCKNEWGLIAMSVSYALLNHVDSVWVLDDGSSDESAAGFLHLKKLWGDRLTVLNLDSIGFEQEAITNTLIQLAMLTEKPDWIYPFDADEFLVLDEGRSLRELLDQQPESVDQVRYGVKNFISPRDFNENSIADYRRQTYRSRADRVASIETKAREIAAGTATFFDFGFMNKTVIRARTNIRLDRGSHSSKVFGREQVSVTDETMRAVHLPMLTRQRIDRKAKQGKAHVAVGAPGGRGWQNQFIYKQEQQGRLDEFWNQHSIDPANVPDTVTDTTLFTDAIESTIVFLTSQFGSDDLSAPHGKKLAAGRSPQTTVGLDEVVRVGFAFQEHTNALLRRSNHDRRSTLRYRWNKSWRKSRKSLIRSIRRLLGRGGGS
jgi:hypothetical protein